jgi:hypothetical protein
MDFAQSWIVWAHGGLILYAILRWDCAGWLSGFLALIHDSDRALIEFER